MDVHYINKSSSTLKKSYSTTVRVCNPCHTTRAGITKHTEDPLQSSVAFGALMHTLQTHCCTPCGHICCVNPVIYTKPWLLNTLRTHYLTANQEIGCVNHIYETLLLVKYNHIFITIISDVTKQLIFLLLQLYCETYFTQQNVSYETDWFKSVVRWRWGNTLSYTWLLYYNN